MWIAHQDRIPKLNAYAKTTGVDDYFFDPDDKVSRAFGMTYGAGVVFINRDGIVKARTAKAISPERLESELAKILK